jgi:hypothetical protein
LNLIQGCYYFRTLVHWVRGVAEYNEFENEKRKKKKKKELSECRYYCPPPCENTGFDTLHL